MRDKSIVSKGHSFALYHPCAFWRLPRAAEVWELSYRATDPARHLFVTAFPLSLRKRNNRYSEKLLLDIVKNLPEAAVESSDERFHRHGIVRQIVVHAQNARAARLPPFPNVDVSVPSRVPFAEFCSMVKRAWRGCFRGPKAVQCSEGVLISTSDEGLVHGCDRLCIALPWPDVRLRARAGEFRGDCFRRVPSGGCRPAKDGRKHYIGLTANQIVFTYQNMVLINRRIEAISRTIVRLFHSHGQRRRASLRRSSLPQEARGLGECFRRP